MRSSSTPQGDLFDSETAVDRPDRLGKSEIAYHPASSILTKGAGFMSEYDYTLNPYSGCSFGCTYCYAAFFSRSKDLQDTWGQWVRVKENAVDLMQRKRHATLHGKTVYMSSVTDPYQPIEKKLELTRALLKVMVASQPRLVVQTRSPLVTRDLDLFARLEHVQVNMTVTTDDDRIRRAFEPTCPNNKVRLEAIAQVAAAGIPSVITMTPLLPVRDPDAFAARLLATGVRQFIVQPFHASQGRFVAGTQEEALRVSEALGWSPERYEEVVRVLQAKLPNVGFGKAGFAPQI